MLNNFTIDFETSLKAEVKIKKNTQKLASKMRCIKNKGRYTPDWHYYLRSVSRDIIFL